MAAALRLEAGAPVCALPPVRTADGRPVVDSIDWCRPDVLPPQAMAGLDGGSIYAALAERGPAGPPRRRDDRARHGKGRRGPTAGVRAGALLLTLFQLDSTADGTVVLVSQEHHLADAFEFTVYRRGPGRRLGWRE